MKNLIKKINLDKVKNIFVKNNSNETEIFSNTLKYEWKLLYSWKILWNSIFVLNYDSKEYINKFDSCQIELLNNILSRESSISNVISEIKNKYWNIISYYDSIFFKNSESTTQYFGNINILEYINWDKDLRWSKKIKLNFKYSKAEQRWNLLKLYNFEDSKWRKIHKLYILLSKWQEIQWDIITMK